MNALNRAVIVGVVAISAAASFAADEPIETTADRAQQNLLNFVALQPDPKLKNFSGVVKLRVAVGADGKVSNITIISGDPRVTGRVVDAVRQWVYKPFTQGGKPVAVVFPLDVPIQPAPSGGHPVMQLGHVLGSAMAYPVKRYVDVALGKNHHQESGMHACKSGYAMQGAEIDKDVLWCRQVSTDPSSEESKVDADPPTEREGAHACPAGWYMRGLRAPNPFNRGKNALLCSRSPNVTLLGEKKDDSNMESPTCALEDVGACPQGMPACPNDAPVMTGVHFATWHGRSVFLCSKTGR
jgi:Gram-negative bacterial TonB protein C-terminal